MSGGNDRPPDDSQSGPQAPRGPDDDLPQLPRRTLRTTIGLTGTILLTLMACNVAFMATCGTVTFLGIMDGTGDGGAALALGVILGIVAAGFVGHSLCLRFFGIGKPSGRK